VIAVGNRLALPGMNRVHWSDKASDGYLMLSPARKATAIYLRGSITGFRTRGQVAGIGRQESGVTSQ